MKKILLGVAAFALLLATPGCNNETTEKANTNDGQIKFQTYLGKQINSRASEMNLAGLKTAANSEANAIPVYAYKNDTTTPAWREFDIYYNATDDVWTYGQPVLQPGFDLIYTSVHPATGITQAGSGSAGVTFDYTVPAAASQVDLIAAYHEATGDNDIDLLYKHVLSQVNFELQNVENLKITINSIEFAGILSKGTYTFGTGWGATANTAATYAYDLSGTTFPTDGTITESKTTLKTATNALMLMPQEFTDDSATFTINFTLEDMSGSSTPLVANKTATILLKEFDTTTWVAGKRYLYLIDFTNYFADNFINFTVDVSDWTNDTPVTLPVEVATATKASIEGAINTLLTAHPGLSKYQINVNSAPIANIELTIAEIATTDTEIVINFEKGLDSKTIDLDTATQANWGIATSGNIVTLTAK